MSYSVVDLFYKKRDKAAFRRIIRSLHSSDISEISFAKSISSVITHILIEMEGSESKEESINIAIGYHLYDWLGIQNDLLTGYITVESAIKQIQDLLEESNEK